MSSKDNLEYEGYMDVDAALPADLLAAVDALLILAEGAMSDFVNKGQARN